MKRFIGIIVLTILVALTGQSAIAQTYKFGHINSQELIQAMPEYDSANIQLQAYQSELINALDLMSVELNNKSEAYRQESASLTEIVRQNKEQELIDMNRRITDFQTSAQEKYQGRQAELLQPIYNKADKAIKDVGKENGFLYIFDLAQGTLLYFDEAQSTNVINLAMAKLGLQ